MSRVTVAYLQAWIENQFKRAAFTLKRRAGGPLSYLLSFWSPPPAPTTSRRSFSCCASSYVTLFHPSKTAGNTPRPQPRRLTWSSQIKVWTCFRMLVEDLCIGHLELQCCHVLDQCSSGEMEIKKHFLFVFSRQRIVWRSNRNLILSRLDP